MFAGQKTRLPLHLLLLLLLLLLLDAPAAYKPRICDTFEAIRKSIDLLDGICGAHLTPTMASDMRLVLWGSAALIFSGHSFH